MSNLCISITLAPDRERPVRLWRDVRTVIQQSNEYIYIPDLTTKT